MQSSREGFIDIPYNLLKKAVERIEEKKAVCDILPCARFTWEHSRITGDEIQVGEYMPNLYGPFEHSHIKQTVLCCNEISNAVGISAEHCLNCLRLKRTIVR